MLAWVGFVVPAQGDTSRAAVVRRAVPSVASFLDQLRGTTVIAVAGDTTESSAMALHAAADTLAVDCGAVVSIIGANDLRHAAADAGSLVLAGTADALGRVSGLVEHCRALSAADRPAPGKALLEVIDGGLGAHRRVLVVAGGDERGLLVGLSAIITLVSSRRAYQRYDAAEEVIESTIRPDVAAVVPRFAACTSAAYFVEQEGHRTFLANFCPSLLVPPTESLDRPTVQVEWPLDVPVDRPVVIRGKHLKRAVELPTTKSQNPRYEESTYDVLLVGSIMLLNAHQQERSHHAK
jgi:hypothetical protein